MSLATRLSAALRAFGKPSGQGRVTSAQLLEAYLAGISRFRWSTLTPQLDPYTAYCCSLLVYAPVFRKANALASVPFRVYQGDPEGEYEMLPQDHPAARILKNPTFFTTESDLWLTAVMYVETRGAAPLLVEAFPGDDAGISVLDPQLLTVVPGKKGDRSVISHYKYGGETGRPKNYLPEDIVMIRWPRPGDPLGWHAPYEAAARAVHLDSRAQTYNAAILENGGAIDKYISVAKEMFGGMMPDDEQIDELLAKYRARQTGPENAGKAMVLWGAEVKDAGRPPRDVEYMAGRKKNLKEALSAFGVTPLLVGDLEEAGKLANADMQDKSFWQNTMVPLGARFEACLNSPDSGLFWRWGDNKRQIWGAFDWSEVAALQEGKETKSVWVSRMVRDNLIMLNEGRQEMGFEPAPGRDIYFSDTQPALGAFGPEEDGTEPTPTDKSARRRSLAEGPRRQALWRAFDATLKREEKMWARGWKAFSGDQVVRVMGRLTSGVGRDPSQVTADALYPRDEEATEMRDAAHPLYLLTVGAGGRAGAGLVKAEAKRIGLATAPARNGARAEEEEYQFDPLSPEVRAYVRNLEQRLVSTVSRNRWEEVRRAIEAAQAESLSWDALVESLRGSLQSWREDWNMLRVARTETLKSYNGGAHLAYRQSGLVEKQEWLDSQDENVRESHSDIEPKVIGLTEKFRVGNSELAYPGDPAGAPEEVINCRCTVLPVVEVEA